MNRLRTIAHVYLLPLVIGTLVLRALIPAGFMPPSGAGFSLTATMCSSPSEAVPGTELIEIPGGGPPAHCDFCLVPMMGAPAALPPATIGCLAPAVVSIAPADAPYSRFALTRAQIARAPPAA